MPHNVIMYKKYYVFISFVFMKQQNILYFIDDDDDDDRFVFTLLPWLPQGCDIYWFIFAFHSLREDCNVVPL